MNDKVTIPASATRLDPSQLEQYKETAKEIDLSQCMQLTEIPDFAFQNFELLERILLPDGLKRIGTFAIAGCPNLKSIEIPDSVEELGVGFMNCSGIKALKLPALLRALDSIDDLELLDMSQCNSIQVFPQVYKCKTVYLPSELEVIPDGKLRYVDYCYAPDTVKTIGAMEMVGLFCNSPAVRFNNGSRRCIIHTTNENLPAYKKMADRANSVDVTIDTPWFANFLYYLK